MGRTKGCVGRIHEEQYNAIWNLIWLNRNLEWRKTYRELGDMAGVSMDSVARVARSNGSWETFLEMKARANVSRNRRKPEPTLLEQVMDPQQEQAEDPQPTEVMDAQAKAEGTSEKLRETVETLVRQMAEFGRALNSLAAALEACGIE